jgi:cytochrome c peroxidase
MHAGQFARLADAIAHYDRAPRAPAGHSELKALRLSAAERGQLEAFLRTLSAPVGAPQAYLHAPTGAGGRGTLRGSAPEAQP